jgi:hypothetical protein
MDEDDLERRIADLEGRATEPVGDTGEESSIRRAVKAYWMPVAIAVLTLFGYSLTRLERDFPSLKDPAPSWVGLLFLIAPFAAVAFTSWCGGGSSWAADASDLIAPDAVPITVACTSLAARSASRCAVAQRRPW